MNDEKGMRGMRRSTKRGSREKGRCGLARANGEGRTGIAYLRNEYGGRTVCLLPYSPSFQREKVYLLCCRLLAAVTQLICGHVLLGEMAKHESGVSPLTFSLDTILG